MEVERREGERSNYSVNNSGLSSHARGRIMQGRGMVSGRVERDEDLALFLEMHQRERERKSNPAPAHSASDSAEAQLGARLVSSSLHRMAAQPPSTMYRSRTGEDLLTSDSGKNDYDWLLTPPGTPSITTSDHDPSSIDAAFVSHKGLPNLVRSLAAIKTARGLSNAKSEPLSKGLGSTRVDAPSKLGRSNLYSSSVPTRRSSLAPCSTPSSRPVSRSTTPTSRPTISSSTRTTSVPPPSTRSGPSSRSTTPLRRPATPLLSQQTQSSQPLSSRPTSVNKASSGLPSKSTPTSRGNSPTMRPRAWQPSAMPGFSLEPPPNLRTTIPARSLSNSRGSSVGTSRTATTGVAAPTTSSSARTGHAPTDAAPDRSRRQSCSPSVTRGRLSTVERLSNSSSSSITSMGNANGAGETILRSSKMVDKMIQSRRAAAMPVSQQQDAPPSVIKRMVKPTTPNGKDTSGYGRNLSRRSMDMALRHMDLRQSGPNGLRSLVSNMVPSSFYSVKSVSGRGRPGYSPITTSSTASSEHSMSIVRDAEGSEAGEEVSSEMGSKASPMSLSDSVYSLSKDARINSWVSSPDYRDDSVELMQLFRQGIEKLSGSESPLVCPHGGSSNCELCNVKTRLQNLSSNVRASLQLSEEVWKGNSPYSSSSNGVSSPGQC